jgi:hypothetical protein
MKGSRFLESVTTQYFLFTILLIIAVILGGFAIVLGNKLTSIGTLATFVDVVFKTVALIAGCLWALNRYFVGRTDVMQLRVETDVRTVHADEFMNNENSLALLIFRLDVVNTGKSLIPAYSQYLQVESVVPSSEGINYQLLHRWPTVGLHGGNPIEPNSWSAINNAISIPSDVKAVRFYLEIQLSENNVWTWHKTFDVSKGNRDG